MRRFFGLTVALIGLIAGLLLVRTMRYGVDQAPSVASTATAVPVDAAERLAGSLRFATISNEDPAAFDTAAFRALHAYLESSFPRVHTQLRRETVAARRPLSRPPTRESEGMLGVPLLGAVTIGLQEKGEYPAKYGHYHYSYGYGQQPVE